MGALDLALNTVRTTKALTGRGATAVPSIISAGAAGAGGGVAAAGFQGFARAMQTNEIVYSAINLLATSAAEPEIIGHKWGKSRDQVRADRYSMRAMGMSDRIIDQRMMATGAVKEMSRHPLVRLLNHPNPFRSRGAFWGTMVMDRKLAGNAYALKAPGSLGQTAELWRLRPDRVRIIPDRQKFIAGYEYKVGNESVVFPPEQVVHFKELNPLDDFYGMPPLLAAASRIDIDSYMKSFLKGFFESGGAGPGSILTVSAELDDDEKQEIRDRFRRTFGGPSGFHEMLIIDNSQTSYQQLGLNRGLRDALPKELHDLTEAGIAMVFGIPGSILGLLIGYESSSYANKRADWQVLWDVTMAPLMREMGDVLNLSFLSESAPEFGGIDEVCWDTSDIRALQEDEDALQDRARKNYMAGGLSWQEFRESIGADPAVKDGHFLLPAGQALTTVDASLEPKEEWTPAADILLKVLGEVTAGALDPEAARIVLRVSFPSLDPAEIDRMVDASAGFEPKAPAPGTVPSPKGPDNPEPPQNRRAGVTFGSDGGDAGLRGLGVQLAEGVRGSRGRPPLSADTEAREVYERAEALRRTAPSMTLAQVANRVGISERTYRRYRDEFR